MSFKNIFLVVRHVIEKKEKSSKRVRKEFGDCGVGVSVFEEKIGEEEENWRGRLGG